MGQGWIESRVRNNQGDQIVVASNPGAAADQISISISFRARARPRRAETVEIVFDVDGATFEWDIADNGEAEFVIHGTLWREVQALKAMLAAMRTGNLLEVSVPALDLGARFTLEGAFDVLLDAAKLGDAGHTD
jgi:hypothetical protein